MSTVSPLSPSAEQPRRALVLAACMASMFMAAIEATIVATAMPSIVGALGGFELFSWVFSIYLLAQAVTIPVYGKLADMFGRKRALYTGAALFLAGSTLAGLAPSMEALIACRALQGLGAGALMPVAATVIGDVYPGPERGRVQGWLSSVWGISAVTGPALGALLVESFGWPLVFWLNIPVGIGAMALMAFSLHEPAQRHERHRIDWAGAVLMVCGTGALMLALMQGASLPLALLVGLAGLAALCAAGFIVVERRASEPMMPLHLWRNRVIATGNLGQLAAGCVMIGVTSFVPTYVQGVMGRPPLAAGFALTAMSVGWPLAATLSGRLMASVAFRWTTFVGGAGLLAGSLVLAALTPERGAGWAAAGAFLVGFGMGFCNTTFVVATQATVHHRQRGAATSTSLFMRMLGQSAGAALFGAMLNHGVERAAPGMHDVVDRLLLPDAREAVPADQVALLTGAMADALTGVYLIAALFGLAVVLLALRLPRGLNTSNAQAG